MSADQQETCTTCRARVATDAEVNASGPLLSEVCYEPYGAGHAETEEWSEDWSCRALRAETKLAEVETKLKHLQERWEWLSETVDLALWDKQSRAKGGQQTGHGPELSYIPTSDLLRLQWRCKEALKVCK